MSYLRLLVTGVGLVAALALVPTPVHTQAGDLDLLDDATLERDLIAELDDIYANFAPDDEFSLEDLRDAMLDALKDEGDEGIEEEISLEELEQEMQEADTTLAQVIDDALEEADDIASSGRQTWSIVRVGTSPDMAAQRRGNGRTTPRQGTRLAARALVRVAKSAK